jgi:putative DNA primase/helicase
MNNIASGLNETVIEETAYEDACRRAAELEEVFKQQSQKEILPDGFYFSDSRLEYCDPNKDEEEPSSIYVCSKLEVIACTRDQNNQNHGRLLKFKDIDDYEHRIALPMELLASDGTKLRELLLSHGLEIGASKRSRQLLTHYIQACHPRKRVRCVPQIGWHNGCFVLPHTAIGETGEEDVLLQTVSLNVQKYMCKGSLQDWQQNIAAYCPGNSRLTFAISSAFAPPLLELLCMEGGGANIKGHSSTGKTSVLKAAASVWGGSDYLQRWRATANGLEAIAGWHNHTLLCLDELSQIDPEAAGEAAYMLANGRGKTRADRAGQYRSPIRWQLLFLSTGELSLAHHIMQTGKTARAGQEVRVIDLDAEVGRYGIFEELHGMASGAQLADHLSEMSQSYYGVASRIFLSTLVSQTKGAIFFVTEMMNRFQAHVEERILKNAINLPGQVTRVARRFALIAAAGELATKMGITGWPEKTAYSLVYQCFIDWISSRGSLLPYEEDAGLEKVRLFFQLHGDSRFARWDQAADRTIIQRAGFKKQDDEGAWEFYVFTEVFKTEICKGIDPSYTAKVCIKHGLLLPSSDNKTTRRERLPGIGPTRCYRFTSKVLNEHEE